ncbi:ankyrin repeat-containing domain protein, partial [Xylaria arbuscula]
TRSSILQTPRRYWYHSTFLLHRLLILIAESGMMSDKEPKAFTWRVSFIPKGVTKNQLLEFFVPEDRARVAVYSLYPSAEDDNQLTATVLFRPHRGRPDTGPKTTHNSPPELDIDKDFEGFTTLYCPTEETTIAADIIAVTGLAGHAFGSWASSEKSMWLRDYVPEFASNARVLTYGYDSHITGPNTSISKLSDLSQTFVQMLIDMRDQYTREQRDSSRLPVRAIIFLEAPHRGMDTKALRNVVKNTPPEHLIAELSPESETLKSLNEGFSTFAQDITILSCYENRPSKTVVFDEATQKWTRSGEEIMILPQSSASQFLPKEKLLPANADHSGIAKLRKNRDIYSGVKATIIQALVPTVAISREERRGPMLGYLQEQHSYGHPAPHDSDQYIPKISSQISTPPPIYAPHSGDLRIPFFAHRSYTSNSFQGSGQTPYTPDASPDPGHSGGYASNPGYMDRNSPLPRPQLQRGPESSSTNSGDPASPMPTGLEDNYNLATATNEGFAGPNPQYNVPHHIPYEAGLPHSAILHQIPSAEMMQSFTQMNLDPPHPDQYPAQSQEPRSATPNQPSELICDGCDTSIKGLFYHCKECPDWDLCHECFQIRLTIHPSHEFKIVRAKEKESNGLRPNHSESDGAARIGRAKCARCKMDIVSPDFFYICSTCSNERICQPCQGDSAFCLLHTKPAQKRQFIFYGKEMDTDIWIAPEPTVEDSVIVRALKDRDMDLLDKLLHDQNSRQTLLNGGDSHGRSPLHIAAHLDLYIEAKFLIMHRANLEAKDNDSYTPLGQALLSKNNEMACQLIDRGAKPYSVNPEGITILHLACAAGCHEIVKGLLGGYGKDVDLKLVDAKNKSQQTALFRACQAGEFKIAALLLDAGAKPDASHGEATQIGELAAANNSEAIEFLLAHGAAVDSQDSLSQTLLCRAAESGHSELCQTLIARGANPNVRKGEGTLLGYVAANGNKETAEALIKGGADIEGSDDLACIPLYRAVEAANLEMCLCLLELKADPNHEEAVLEGYNKMSPLRLAAGEGHEAIVKLLLGHGAKIEAHDIWGNTPLHFAANYGRLAACKVLVNAGADINVCHLEGDNVVTTAARCGHLEVVRYLLSQGASGMPPRGFIFKKWKYLDFFDDVKSGRKAEILALLREYKHR